MFEVPLLLVLIVITALIFDFTNGAHDCANAIATVVSTKVATPRMAVTMAALLNLLGAFLGTEVAKTLGGGLVYPAMVEGSQILVFAALVGAIVWNLLTWYLGIPSSSSHALIGGLLGLHWLASCRFLRRLSGHVYHLLGVRTLQKGSHQRLVSTHAACLGRLYGPLARPQ